MTRAQQRERTKADLVAAAERRFTRDGFHATSVDQIAGDAGYTKGAVYSNFASKEDLFFAVYEQRAARSIAEAERAIAEAGPYRGLGRVTDAAMRRRERDDGWLAVFYEFWAHVIRHPEHRERFAAIHGRAQVPFVEAVRRYAEERGVESPLDPERLTAAVMAMQVGLSLERLTRPEVVDAALAADIGGLVLRHLHGGGDDGDEGAGRPAGRLRGGGARGA